MNAHTRLIGLAATAPLANLIHDVEANVRTDGRGKGLEELMASIAEEGLIQPLGARRVTAEKAPHLPEGSFAVFAGSRRLEAMRKLTEAGKLPSDLQAAIPITIFDCTDEEARELSLAENIVRLGMHPIDQFEAFSRLAEGGATPAEIARRFGVDELLVKKRVALGGLHPDIRDAWRKGVIDENEARAFTVAKNPKTQAKVFRDLDKKDELHVPAIRAALGAKHDAGAAIAFIGADAYRAAGGTLVEDLFGTAPSLSDPDLAKQLAEGALRKECDRLQFDESWSFALVKAHVKDSGAWRRLEPAIRMAPELEAEHKRLNTLVDSLEKSKWNGRGRGADVGQELADAHAAIDVIEQGYLPNAFSARQKSKAGCFVEINPLGKLEITYGVRKPEDPKKAKPAAKAKPAGAEDEGDAGDAPGEGSEPEAAEEPVVSNALLLSLAQQRTIAASMALREEPDLALSALIATLETAYGSPLKITTNGYASPTRDDGEEEGEDDISSADAFGKRLAELSRLSILDQLKRLASAVACTLQFASYGVTMNRGADALVAALAPETFRREARKAFDAAGYFKSVNAALCNLAADEMGLPSGKARPKKKADLAALCVAEAATTGWLPAQLRHPGEGQ